MITVGRNNFKEKQVEIRNNLRNIIRDIVDNGEMYNDAPTNRDDKSVMILDPLRNQFVGWYANETIELFAEFGINDVTVVAEVDHLVGHPKLYLAFPKSPNTKGDR